MNLTKPAVKMMMAIVAGVCVIAVAAGIPGAGIKAQAAAPGTPAYIQAVNKAIMYTEGVYEDSEGEPMSLADNIACAFADAKPSSVGKSYAAQGSYQPAAETTSYQWNGANIASRTDKREGSNYQTQWNYTWDASGYLSGLHIQPQQRSRWIIYSAQDSKGASVSVQLGADGRPAAMNAPMVYPWYADHQQRLYAFAYDTAGRIIAMSCNVADSETGQTTTTVNQYTYNPDGTLKMVSDGSSRYQVFHYDVAGRLAMSFDETVGSGGDKAIAYGYDAANRPNAAICYSNGQLYYQQVYNY